jgi:AmmeMemoRadiSam system protein A
MKGAARTDPADGEAVHDEATTPVEATTPTLPVRLAFAALADWLAGFPEPSAKSPRVAALLNTLDVTSQKMLEELYARRAGAFVSFHKGADLRGCIGTIEATCKNVFEEICQNTVSAAGHDPRFSAIRDKEVPSLSCSVDLLGQAEPVTNRDELDAKRFGVIVSKGFRRGLLLPDLEGVDTPQEQIAIALRKAGITPNESYDLERFEVVRYE